MSVVKKIKEKIGEENFAFLKELFSGKKKETFIAIVTIDGISLQVDKLEKGAAVSVVTDQGAKAAESGKYSYTDDAGKNWTINVDNGVITDLIEESATAVPPPVIPPIPPVVTGNDPAAMMAALKEMAAKFDVIPGATPAPVDATLQDIITMLKAVMDYCFGWEIREGERRAAVDTAIAVYKENMSKSTTEAFELKDKENKIQFEKIAAQEKQIADLTEAGKKMFELIERIGELPALEDIEEKPGNTGVTFKRNAARQQLIDSANASRPAAFKIKLNPHQ